MSATQFFFRPGEGELIETVVHMNPDTESSIHGYVRDGESRAIPGALVVLFDSGENEKLSFRTQTFTDESGHFIFGPLTPGQLYMIKVFKDEVKIRELQIRSE